MTKVPQHLPRVFTVKKTADELDVSPKTVRRLIASGELPVTRVGRSIRIMEADLLDLLMRRRTR